MLITPDYQLIFIGNKTNGTSYIEIPSYFIEENLPESKIRLGCCRCSPCKWLGSFLWGRPGPWFFHRWRRTSLVWERVRGSDWARSRCRASSKPSFGSWRGSRSSVGSLRGSEEPSSQCVDDFKLKLNWNSK